MYVCCVWVDGWVTTWGQITLDVGEDDDDDDVDDVHLSINTSCWCVYLCVYRPPLGASPVGVCSVHLFVYRPIAYD